MSKRVKKTRRSSKKDSAKDTATDVVVREVNGGQLLTGNPGNAGGLGVVPSAVRQLCLGSFHARVPILEQIADGEAVVTVKDADGVDTKSKVSAPPRDRIKAIEVLGKYAGLEKLTIEQEKPPQAEGTGEQVMAKVMSQLVRAALSATEVQRLAMIRELEQAE